MTPRLALLTLFASMPYEDNPIHALLGAETRYEGKLFFDGRVRIDGDFEGEVVSEGILVVGEGATIRGKIRVGTFIVRGGHVNAEIRASELVELHAGARVEGEIHTPALFVEKGAVFDGSSVMAEVHPLVAQSETETSMGTAAVYSDQPTRN